MRPCSRYMHLSQKLGTCIDIFCCYVGKLKMVGIVNRLELPHRYLLN
jgi:hypothetical protein